MKKCQKKALSHTEAIKALSNVKSKNRPEKRIYKCGCGFWHLTSMSEGKLKRKREQFEKWKEKQKEMKEWNQLLIVTSGHIPTRKRSRKNK